MNYVPTVGPCNPPPYSPRDQHSPPAYSEEDPHKGDNLLSHIWNHYYNSLIKSFDIFFYMMFLSLFSNITKTIIRYFNFILCCWARNRKSNSIKLNFLFQKNPPNHMNYWKTPYNMLYLYNMCSCHKEKSRSLQKERQICLTYM